MTVDFHKTVVARLEDAGRTLMTLPMPPRSMPAEPQSAWPDYRQKYWDVFGHADEDTSEERREIAASQINSVRLQASQKAVDRLDEVLGWLCMIQDNRHKRLVFARMQIHPGSNKHVYSWRKLMPVFCTSLWHLQQWHKEGVEDILRGLYEKSYCG